MLMFPHRQLRLLCDHIRNPYPKYRQFYYMDTESHSCRAIFKSRQQDGFDR